MVRALLVLFAATLASARAEPILQAYFNGGDPAALRAAVGTDYTHVDVAFLLPNPDGNALGFDAIATSFYGSTVTTGIAQSIRALQADGKKVLLSFGGSTVTSAQYAALGANVPSLAAGISRFVKNPVAADGQPLHFDGIDIDFEDTAAFANGGSGAGYRGVNFLIDLTKELRLPANLPSSAGWLLTHAPQPPYLSKDPFWSGDGIGGYIPVLNAVADQIDWINLQYYNNGDAGGHPGFNTAAQAVSSYRDIASGWSGVAGVPDFAGLAPRKLVVGKPVGQADAGSGWLPADAIARDIVGPLVADDGRDFGGVFGFKLESDPDGAWAATIHDAFPVPEPSALALLAAGAMLLAWSKSRFPTRAACAATPRTGPPTPPSPPTPRSTIWARASRSARRTSPRPRSAPAW